VHKKKIIVSVSNDLSTDQRVFRTCSLLEEMNFEIILVGRVLKNSTSINRNYQCRRFKILVNKGFLFYSLFNIRLFFYLLIKKTDFLFANDLDTLLPNIIISKLKRKPLVYDSHEYFTEVPEIQNRKIVKFVWQSIEKICLSNLTSMITVNNSIAKLYNSKFKIKVDVVRNVPLKTNIERKSYRAELNLPKEKFIIIIQGAGINIDRGAEEALETIKNIDNSILLIVGQGDVVPFLKAKVEKENLSNKVIFVVSQPLSQLYKYTMSSDLGLTLDKPNNINYLYSLPNKLFDYIQAGTPVLASNLPEVANIVNKYNIGLILKNITPQEISEQINILINQKDNLKTYSENCIKAANILCWENEKEVLKQVIIKLMKK